ncbi:MAG: selenium metabolism-associated LysR family transcriptional regulator [bacterium]
MGFWQLFVFIKVIEHRSFSGAAKACNLTQPTVSSHIKQLETYLDCILIDRVGKEAVATGVGKILYDYARKLMAMMAEAETAVLEFQGNMKGDVIIGGSTIPGSFILPELLSRFRECYPHVRFSLDISNTGTVIEKLLDGSVELAIVGARSDHKQIDQKEIIVDEMMLVIPGRHRWSKLERISFAALRKEPFIRRENASGTWKSFANSLRKVDYDIDELNIVAEISNTAGVISGVRNGLGISVISSIAISEGLTNGSLKALKITNVDMRRSFYLTWNRGRSMSPLVSLLKNFIEQRTGVIKD